MKRKLLPLIALVFCMLMLFLGCELLTQTSTSFPPQNSLVVHYLDVGQGDSMLLVDRDDTMLIDEGNPENGTAIVNYLNKLGITQLDYVVAVYPKSPIRFILAVLLKPLNRISAPVVFVNRPASR